MRTRLKHNNLPMARPGRTIALYTGEVQGERKLPNQKRKTFMKLQKTIATTAGLLLFAASMFGQIKTDYDRGADFAQYKTYSWERVQTQNPLWVDRIKSAVNSELSAKGWTEVP